MTRELLPLLQAQEYQISVELDRLEEEIAGLTLAKEQLEHHQRDKIWERLALRRLIQANGGEAAVPVLEPVVTSASSTVLPARYQEAIMRTREPLLIDAIPVVLKDQFLHLKDIAARLELLGITPTRGSLSTTLFDLKQQEVVMKGRSRGYWGLFNATTAIKNAASDGVMSPVQFSAHLLSTYPLHFGGDNPPIQLEALLTTLAKQGVLGTNAEGVVVSVEDLSEVTQPAEVLEKPKF